MFLISLDIEPILFLNSETILSYRKMANYFSRSKLDIIFCIPTTMKYVVSFFASLICSRSQKYTIAHQRPPIVLY